MDFFSALSLYATHGHLVAKGELDAFAAFELRHRLDEAIERGCRHVTVDTSAVTFVDAGGLGLLVWLNNRVAGLGGSLAVVAASPRFRQIADLVGLGTAFGLDRPPAVPPPLARVVPLEHSGRRGIVQRLAVVPPRSGWMSDEGIVAGRPADQRRCVDRPQVMRPPRTGTGLS